MGKQRYRGPEIVDVGDAAEITTGPSTPVRDNPGEEPPTFGDPPPPEDPPRPDPVPDPEPPPPDPGPKPPDDPVPT